MNGHCCIRVAVSEGTHLSAVVPLYETGRFAVEAKYRLARLQKARV